MNPPAPGASVSYRERLRPPVSWWLVAAAVALPTAAAVAWGGDYRVHAPLVAQLAVASVILLLPVALLIGAGRAGVEVTAGSIVAGRAQLPLQAAGRVEVLDAAATRRRLGPEADPAAYLLVRPWLHTAVSVTVDDPDDDTPYWLVTCRHPDRVAAAIAAARVRR